MHRLLHRLINRIGIQAEHRSDPGGSGRTQMRNVILLELVQTNRAHQIHLDLIADEQPAQQVRTAAPTLLRDGEQWRDVVTRMRIIRREKRIVHVQLADSHAVRPRRPFAVEPLRGRQAEDRGTMSPRMRSSLRTGVGHGRAIDGRQCHRGIINDAVDHHFACRRINRRLIGGDGGNFPRQLVAF